MIILEIYSRGAKFTIFANWLEEKNVKIPDFLASKTKKLSKLIRNNKQTISPFEISRMENLVNGDLGDSKENNFRLVVQLRTIFVRNY